MVTIELIKGKLWFEGWMKAVDAYGEAIVVGVLAAENYSSTIVVCREHMASPHAKREWLLNALGAFSKAVELNADEVDYAALNLLDLEVEEVDQSSIALHLSTYWIGALDRGLKKFGFRCCGDPVPLALAMLGDLRDRLEACQGGLAQAKAELAEKDLDYSAAPEKTEEQWKEQKAQGHKGNKGHKKGNTYEKGTDDDSGGQGKAGAGPGGRG